MLNPLNKSSIIQMSDPQDPVLLQQIEFLQLQLEDAKIKEANLQKLNDSLMEALNKTERNPLRDFTISELEKVNQQYHSEIQDLQSRIKASSSSSDQGKTKILSEYQELLYEFKKFKLVVEDEKLELMKRAQNLEAQKFELEKQLEERLQEQRHGREDFQNQLNHQISNVIQEYEYQLQETQQDREDAIMNLKSSYNREIQDLKRQLQAAHDQIAKDAILRKELEQENQRLRQSHSHQQTLIMQSHNNTLIEEIQDLKASLSQSTDIENLLREQLKKKDRMLSDMRREVRKYQEQKKGSFADYYHRTQASIPLKLSQENLCLMENRPRTIPNKQMTTRRNDDFLENTIGDFQTEAEKDKDSDSLRMQIERLNLQKEKTQVELEKAMFELKQYKTSLGREVEKRAENEIVFKNEIKFLIGKLLKAKSKLQSETELNDTWRPTQDNTRSRSVLKMNNRGTPLKRAISPLNLSAISRTESPFGISTIDLDNI